jgi:hypothetical protein
LIFGIFSENLLTCQTKCAIIRAYKQAHGAKE